MTPRAVTVPVAARGIPISKLERKALDDPVLQTGCGLQRDYECCDPCWHGWVCARLMEHLRGERYWEELDRGDFGLLRKAWHESFELVEEIVARVATGAGTVAIMIWAADAHKPLEEVMAILRTLDVDARRVPRYPWLSWMMPCGRA